MKVQEWSKLLPVRRCFAALLLIYEHAQKFQKREGLILRSEVRAILLYEAVKKSPGQGTGLGSRGRLKVLNDTKLGLNEHD